MSRIVHPKKPFTSKSECPKSCPVTTIIPGISNTIFYIIAFFAASGLLSLLVALRTVGCFRNKTLDMQRQSSARLDNEVEIGKIPKNDNIPYATRVT